MADTPPSITASGAIVYPAGYAPPPNTGPSVEVTFPAAGTYPITAEVIGADLANTVIAFLRTLPNPPPSPTVAQDAKTSLDLGNYVFNNADSGQLYSIGFTLGHVLGGANIVGDYLAALITNELIIGDGRGFVGVNENLNAYISTFYGPNASVPGSIEQYLTAVAGGWPPDQAFVATLASSPIQLRTA